MFANKSSMFKRALFVFAHMDDETVSSYGTIRRMLDEGVEVAVGNVGPNDDTNIVSMSLKFNDAFITNEGYGIFINSQKVNASGVIVARDETNVRVKYIVEIQNNYF